MASGSYCPSSTSKPASRVSKTRSITAIISDLRSSFRDAEYDEAEQELLSREDNLRREKDKLRREKEEAELNRDLSEADLSGLRLEVVKLEQDLAKLRRECEVNDDKLTELATDLSVAREKEAEANKRYGKMCEKVRVLEEEKEKFLDEVQKGQSLYAEKLTTLSDLVADLRGELREKEGEIDELRGVRVRNEGLEERIKELERNEFDREKEERIKELERKIETLEMEKMEILKENEGLRAEKRQGEVEMDEMEKLVSKLESCVATWMFNAPKDQQLGSVEVEKILCATMKVLDSQGVGVARALASTGTRAERVPVSNVIEIESGSDDDDDDELRSLNKRKEGEGSSEDSLNPRNKMKKLNDLSTTTTSVRSIVRKCNDKLREGSTSEGNQKSTEAITACSPHVKELLATCRRSRAN